MKRLLLIWLCLLVTWLAAAGRFIPAHSLAAGGSQMDSTAPWDWADWPQRTIDSLVTDDPECKAVQTSYDKLGRGTNRVRPDVNLACRYDRLGRVGKRVGTTNTFYLIDNLYPSGWPQVLAEYSSVTTSVAANVAYVYGLALISERLPGSGGPYTNKLYGFDGQGSVRLLMGPTTSATVTDTYDYDAYGLLLARSGSTLNNYLYGCQQWDPDWGMYHLRARFYRPNEGRFWGVDTDQGRQYDPLSLRRYLYRRASPVDRIDPSGRFDLVQITFVASEELTEKTSDAAAKFAFQQGATRGISGALLKAGSMGVIGLSGASLIAQLAYIKSNIDRNPTAGTSLQARQQLQLQMETEEQDRGDSILYHYTDFASAMQIIQDNAIVAFQGKRFLGFTFPQEAYATDIPPWSATFSQSQLSGLFFGGDQGQDMSSYVAIAQNDFYELQYPGYPNQYLRQAVAGTKIPVMIVGAGPSLMSH